MRKQERQAAFPNKDSPTAPAQAPVHLKPGVFRVFLNAGQGPAIGPAR